MPDPRPTSRETDADLPSASSSLHATDRDSRPQVVCLEGRVGRFQLVRELDRGGTGVVYLARDLMARRRAVAVKVCHDDPSLAHRFSSEVQLRSRLDHPNIVRMLDAGVADGRFYLAMEVLDGGSLARQVALGPLPPRRVVELGVVMALALAHVHDRGLIHRDVKPGNILLDWRGAARLTDFGLALDLSRGDGAGQAAGTPAFMAPEQLLGRRLGRQVDVYGLGATLYECLTGAAPFDGGAPRDLYARIVDEAPRPPGERVAGVPAALDRILLRCLAKRPEDRWPTARALAAALAATIDPTTGAHRRPRPGRRPPGVTSPPTIASAAGDSRLTPQTAEPARTPRVAPPPPEAALPPIGPDDLLLAAVDLLLAADDPVYAASDPLLAEGHPLLVAATGGSPVGPPPAALPPAPPAEREAADASPDQVG